MPSNYFSVKDRIKQAVLHDEDGAINSLDAKLVAYNQPHICRANLCFESCFNFFNVFV